MDTRKIVVLEDVALITCIVQRGVADAIVQAARDAGAQGATVHYAKGMGIRERLGILGVAVEVQKEVIQVVASSEQVLSWGSFSSLCAHGFLQARPWPNLRVPWMLNRG